MMNDSTDRTHAILHYETYGSGPRLFVSLHGWSGDHSTFAPLASHLPAEATLVSIDLPGCGRSPLPSRWDLESVGRMIARTIRRVGGAEATIVGNCSGALMALVAATHGGLSPSRLVLIDPFAFFPWYFRIFTLGEFGRRAYHATFASDIGRRITDRSLAARRSSQTSLTSSFEDVDHDTTLAYLRLLTTIESPAVFTGLRMPIDIVVGSRTFGAILRSVSMWREVWPHAVPHCLAGVGHLPIEEATDAIGRIVFGETREPVRSAVA